MTSVEHYRPATRWCRPHPFGAGAAFAAPAARIASRTPPLAQSGRRDVLLQLLADSLARGHWRVALRRFFMLLACGYDIPPELSAVCEHHRNRCPLRELRRMEADAQAWRRCVRGT